MRWVRAALALAIGGAALACFWGARYAYGDFLPLRGYQKIHVHLMASQEGLFLGMYTVLGALAVLGLGLGAAELARSWSLAGFLERAAARLDDRQWVIVVSLLAAAAALAVGFGLLGDSFLTDYEMAMVFEAELLRRGRLWAQPPPFADVFEYAMVIESPRWYGMYPVGHSALLALSLALTGQPRALMALVAAGWVALTFLLARRLYGRGVALLASVLLCLSPFFVFSSGSLAAELSSGLFLLVAANAAIRVDGPRPALMSVTLGLALGAAYVTRPYTALAVGVPLAAWVAWRWFRRLAPGWVPVVALLCAAPFAALYLGVNDAQTGSPWLTAYKINFPEMFRLGFGQDIYGVIHTPALALAVAGLTLLELNAWTLGWAVSLLPVACAVTLERPPGAAILLAAIPACMLVAYMPVPAAGVHDTGPLYYLEVLPMLVILAARGLQLLSGTIEARFGAASRERLAWLAVASTLVGCLVFGGQQALVLRNLAAFNAAPYRAAEQVIDGRALVFVDNPQTTPPSSWVLGVRPPGPDLSDRIIYGNVAAHDRALDVMRWASDRRGYYLSRDRRTGDVSIIPLPRDPVGRRGGRDALDAR
jgi:hypothetical protein